MSLRTFSGGVHPPDGKHLAKDKEFVEADVPELLYFPVSMHIGAPAQVAVKKGDDVRVGTVLAEAGGFVSAAVHSSVSGKVKAVEKRINAMGRKCDTVVVENDYNYTAEPGIGEERDTSALTPKEIIDIVCNAGIAGMGGATFPTHVKLSPPKEKPIDTLIVNGVECEPYLTCDDRLMREKPQEIIEGARLIARAVSAKRIIIGIEANKPEAYKIMSEHAGDDVEVEQLEVKYPQGAEKQLISALLGREVPSGGLPMDAGALVDNVGTCSAVYRACRFNEPLYIRTVTVTGEGVVDPANLIARIGTPVDFLLNKSRRKDRARRVILGGPMMGLAQFDLSVPVIKGTSGILVLDGEPEKESGPCIRCGRCVQGCPANLVPSLISIAAESRNEDMYDQVNALDCIECGTCAYQCPSKRPIVQQVKFLKGELTARRAREKK